MSSKKALYQPAPEELEPPTASSLHQGDQCESKRRPKMKQGVLETSCKGGARPLTSTKRTANATRQGRKPLVVCHNPEVVHSHLKAVGGHGGDLATDTVEVPKIVVMPALSERAQQSGMLPTKKSARKGRFSQSRYKQAAAEAGTKSLQKSPMPGHTLGESFRKNSSAARSKDNLSLHTTQRPGKTSTPTSVVRNSTPNWNMSAINQTQPAATAFVEESIIAPQAPTSNSTGTDDLEILYMRYLQMHLLHLKAKRNMENKSKQAALQLSFLHAKNTQLAIEVNELDEEVAHLKHGVNLQARVDSQRNSLAPVVDKLSSALGQYKMLCDNLDAVSHSLPLSGAKEPDPEELGMALEETRHLLGQISILTNTQAPSIGAMSQEAGSLSGACSKESKTIPITKRELMNGVSAALAIVNLHSQLPSTE